MEIVTLTIVIAVVAILFLALRKPSDTAGSDSLHTGAAMTRSPDPPKGGDYSIWVDIIEKEKSHKKEFDLYGTPAAILWNDGELEISVICITAFRNKQPSTNKWDHFQFNIKEKYWAAATPKGGASVIRNEIQKLGLI